MGLGLTLARRIVAGLGGRIWVESAVGEGSVFHFTIPLQTDPEAGVPEATTPEKAACLT